MLKCGCNEKTNGEVRKTKNFINRRWWRKEHMNAERQKSLQAEIISLEEKTEVIDFEFRGGSELDEERCTERYNVWAENRRRLHALCAEMAQYLCSVQATANAAVDAVPPPLEWSDDSDWRVKFASARRAAAEAVAAEVADGQQRQWIVALATDHLRAIS